ncbi:MAG TPA: hypothetical protein VKT28_03720 [Puia sp.]|nr:hypothetical protein [Puia sp.]
MKKLTQLITVCFASVVICSFKENNKQDELTISAQFINLENSSVEAILWNNAADTIEYFTWSCSWQTSYRTDIKNLIIRKDLCYKVGEVIMKIPPHENVKKTLQLINDNRLHGIKFRIGFNYRRVIQGQKTISKIEGLEKVGK